MQLLPNHEFPELVILTFMLENLRKNYCLVLSAAQLTSPRVFLLQ